MDFLGFLAPIAFVFALGAYAEIQKLKRDVAALKAKLEDSTRK